MMSVGFEIATECEEDRQDLAPSGQSERFSRIGYLLFLKPDKDASP